MPRDGVNFITLMTGCGYGDAACQYMAGLCRLGAEVTWTPIVGDTPMKFARKAVESLMQENVRNHVMPLLQRQLDAEAMVVAVPPFYWQNYWRDAMPSLRPYTYIAWEVETIPEGWLPALNRYERIFVPSEFNRTALVDGGIKPPVDVVPHVARDVSPAVGSMSWGTIEDDDYVFYTIGSWTARKALAETISVYLDTFSGQDKVALIVKTDRLDQIQSYARAKGEKRNNLPHHVMVWWVVAKLLAGRKNPPKVHLIADGISPRGIDEIHTRGDCFLSLTRSEGWGLGAFDATLFGNPVIITGWGGHLEFLGQDYPLLVDYQLRPTKLSPADGCFLFSDDVKWAHASPVSAQEKLLWVYNNKKEAAAIGRQAQPRVKQTYASDRVCLNLGTLMGLKVASQ